MKKLLAVFIVLLLSAGSSWAQTRPNYYQLKDTPFINVRSFGATGNGTTDDTPKIQAAIDSASGTICNLFFPAGTYRITRSLDITSVLSFNADAPELSNRNKAARIKAAEVTGTVFVDNVSSAGSFEKGYTFQNLNIDGGLYYDLPDTPLSTTLEGLLSQTTASFSYDLTIKNCSLGGTTKELAAFVHLKGAVDLLIEDVIIGAMPNGVGLIVEEGIAPGGGQSLATTVTLNSVYFENCRQGMYVEAEQATYNNCVFEWCAIASHHFRGTHTFNSCWWEQLGENPSLLDFDSYRGVTLLNRNVGAAASGALATSSYSFVTVGPGYGARVSFEDCVIKNPSTTVTFLELLGSGIGVNASQDTGVFAEFDNCQIEMGTSKFLAGDPKGLIRPYWITFKEGPGYQYNFGVTHANELRGFVNEGYFTARVPSAATGWEPIKIENGRFTFLSPTTSAALDYEMKHPVSNAVFPYAVGDKKLLSASDALVNGFEGWVCTAAGTETIVASWTPFGFLAAAPDIVKTYDTVGTYTFATAYINGINKNITVRLCSEAWQAGIGSGVATASFWITTNGSGVVATDATRIMGLESGVQTPPTLTWVASGSLYLLQLYNPVAGKNKVSASYVDFGGTLTP